MHFRKRRNLPRKLQYSGKHSEFLDRKVVDKMNRRQKKKQYKKLYGHNPPKGADGRYMFHVQYGCDLAAGQDHTGCYTPEQIEVLKAYKLKPEDIKRIADGFREAFAYAAQAVSDFAAAVSRAFAGVAEQYRKPVIGQAEEPPVVVARSLTERRKNCRRKEWRASRK